MIKNIKKMVLLFEIKIPKDLLEHPIKEKVLVYALDSNTIGVSDKRNELWDQKALWCGDAPLEDHKEYYLLILPYPIASFYKSFNQNYKVSVYKSGKIHIFFEPSLH